MRSCFLSRLLLGLMISSFSLFHRSTALGSAICAGAAIKLFGWDLKNPESLKEVNTKYKGRPAGNYIYTQFERSATREGWQKAVERSRRWEEGVAT